MNNTNNSTVYRCHISTCDTRLDTIIVLASLCCFVVWFAVTLRWLIKNRDLLAMLADPRAYKQPERVKDAIDTKFSKNDCISLSEFEIDAVLAASPKKVMKI
ncbi:hypothetical protein FQR65_LT12243 [Abscondita terminalis]|nr:hypothetical protein FQR65_LT12243 [Abscondita terminalis]